MPHSPIELKGSNFTLSVLQLNLADPIKISQALKDKIQQAPIFLQNAPVVINVDKLPLDADWLAIKQVIEASGLHIVGVSGCQDESQKQRFSTLGLSLLNGVKTQAVLRNTTPAISKSKIVDTPIRSGQQIYARDADLIVTCGVSTGAELVADGNIHVYGVMRGRILAGANGNIDSQIFCTHLSAELVSIAGEYWLSEQIPTEFYGKACRLRLQDHTIIVELLTN